jgi:competence protein ComFB
MEDEVLIIVNRLMDNVDDMCTCEKCRMDVTAIALNNLPTKYVVTEKGELYGKLDTMNYQFETDIIKEVIKAIEKVKKSPQHFN